MRMENMKQKFHIKFPSEIDAKYLNWKETFEFRQDS